MKYFQTLLLHVNRIDLPDEILENVKSFLFYDLKLYKAIKTHKYLIRFIVRDIRNAITRKGCTNKMFMTETSPRWAYISADINTTVIIYATNCVSCGNYVTTNNAHISHKVICACNELVIVRV